MTTGKNTFYVILITLFVGLFLSIESSATSNLCRKFYKSPPIPVEKLYLQPDKAWDMSLEAVSTLRKQFEGAEYLLHPLFTAIMTKEFAWLNGDPGGAKTLISRTVFKAELASLKDDQKKTFVLQFHKLLNEGVLTGFPDLNKMLKNGEYERNIDNSLLAERFVFLIADEVEKSHSALQSTLLSLLNERKAFLGSEVVNLILASGVFTSNKTVGELVSAAGDDRSAIEALVDRMSVKVHVINHTIDVMQSLRMRRKIEWSKANPVEFQSATLHLEPLVNKVLIPRQMLEEATNIMEKVDGLYISKLKESMNAANAPKGARPGDGPSVSKSFFPPNQFSIRSDIKLLANWKAAFISRQLLDGVPYSRLRYKMEPQDFRDLAIGALLNGPGQLREKTVQVEIDLLDPDLGTVIHKVTDAAFEPKSGRLNFTALDGSPLFAQFDMNSGKIIHSSRYLDSEGSEWDASQHLHAEKVFKKLTAAASTVDPKIIEIEDDGILSKYLAVKGTPRNTKEELTMILESRTLFINAANVAISKIKDQSMDYNLRDERGIQEKKNILDESKRVQEKFDALVAKGKNASNFEIYQVASQSVRQSFAELNSNFKELGHAIKAHFTSILGGTHLYSYGPPGGAKTALAKTILYAVLKTVNPSAIAEFNHKVMKGYGEVINKMKANGENYKQFELFFRQFHKMVPEGEITGFQRLDKQLESGTLEYDRKNSLAHQRFLFAILDEVEKGNAALLQKLLSVLNEREVFDGHETVKISLTTAIMTSNKVPFEFLESLREDSSAVQSYATGLALLDRTINKSYVPNKFANRSTLVKLFEEIQSGTFNPTTLISPLMLLELRPLLAQVRFPERQEAFLLSTFHEFVGERLEKQEVSKDAYDAERASNPNFYVPATKRSNRSENAIMDQIKVSWLLEKILSGRLDVVIAEKAANGEKFEDMRFDIEWSDAHVLSQGLAYWGPYEIVPKYSANAVLYFELNDSMLQKQIDSPGTTPRLQYQLKMIQEEAKTLVDMMNRNINQTIKTHRDRIGRYPNLFPGLFKK